MRNEEKTPTWKRVADGIYGESFGHRSRESVMKAAAEWDGEDTEGKALPGDFYLHHQGYLTLQALADLYAEARRTNRYLKLIGQELRVMRNDLAGAPEEDEPTEEVPAPQAAEVSNG